MRQRTIIEHGPRRLFLRPWQVVCRCGLEGWPCYVVMMLQRQAALRAPTATRPPWNGPTRNLPRAPQMTRGQAARSRQAGRW